MIKEKYFCINFKDPRWTFSRGHCNAYEAPLTVHNTAKHVLSVSYAIFSALHLFMIRYCATTDATTLKDPWNASCIMRKPITSEKAVLGVR